LFSAQVVDSHAEFSSSESPALRFDFPLVVPEEIHRDMKRPRDVDSDGSLAIILCDNAGQAERLEELLGDRGASAGLAIGVLHGGFIISPWGMHSAGRRAATDQQR